jgi:hypothetical protein
MTTDSFPPGVSSAALGPAARDGVAHALREYLERNGPWQTPFEGRSMEPSILNGCVLSIEPLPARLQLGDLLVFVHDVRIGVCCHRVIARYANGGVVTQGTNVPIPDGLIDSKRFVGVVRRYRLGGRWYSAPSSNAATRPFVLRRLRHRVERAAARLLEQMK